MGPVMGDAAHAVCVAIFQRLASSFECPRAWCVFYALPLVIVLMKHLAAVSLDSDVDTNKELVAHGYSNFLAGIFGTVPNYLVYVNTLLYVGCLPFLPNLLMKLAQVLSRGGYHATIWPYAGWCNYRGVTRWHRSDRVYS